MTAITKQVQRIDTDTVDVLCNKCGESCKRVHGIECVRLFADWGYDSSKDGTTEQADLCEQCWDALVATFKLPPETST